MKRFLLIASLFACLGLSSCQCSNPPDIGPVEDHDAMNTLAVPAMLPRA